MPTINDVITYFETRYPMSIRDLAYDEKNTGLLHGEKNTKLTSVVLSLECSLEAIDFAKECGANLIICHHTPFFRPIYTYKKTDYRYHVLKALIESDIAVYCSHTAFDRAHVEHNVSGLIASAFNFTDIKPFEQDEQGYGLGAVATVNRKQEALIDILRSKLGTIRTNGVATDMIKTVAIVGGSGEYYWQLAKQKNCDALLTGDLTFHAAQDAKRQNFLIIDISHQAEEIAVLKLEEWLSEKFPVFLHKENALILQ